MRVSIKTVEGSLRSFEISENDKSKFFEDIIKSQAAWILFHNVLIRYESIVYIEIETEDEKP